MPTTWQYRLFALLTLTAPISAVADLSYTPIVERRADTFFYNEDGIIDGDFVVSNSRDFGFSAYVEAEAVGARSINDTRAFFMSDGIWSWGEATIWPTFASEDATGVSRSTVLATFDLDEETDFRFHLSALMYPAFDVLGYSSSGSVAVTLTGNGQEYIALDSAALPGFEVTRENVYQELTLPAGSYTFDARFMHQQVFGQRTSSFGTTEWNMSFAIIPEPSTLLLLLMGLVIRYR